MPVSIPQIFISWSHNEERQIAELLKKLLLECFNVQVFVSSQDIPCDEDFGNIIRENLKAADYGIVCLTKRTRFEPWIMFETGVLMGRHDFSKITFILFDMKFEDMPAPIKTHQALLFNQKDISKLLTTIRNRLSLQERTNIHDIIAEQWSQFSKTISSLINKISKQTKEEIKILSERLIISTKENEQLSTELIASRIGKSPFFNEPIVQYHANIKEDFANKLPEKSKRNSYNDESIVNLTWKVIPSGSEDWKKYQENFLPIRNLFVSEPFNNNNGNSIQYLISKHATPNFIVKKDSNGKSVICFDYKSYPITILKIIDGKIDTSWKRPSDKEDKKKVKNIYDRISQKALRP